MASPSPPPSSLPTQARTEWGWGVTRAARSTVTSAPSVTELTPGDSQSQMWQGETQVRIFWAIFHQFLLGYGLFETTPPFENCPHMIPDQNISAYYGISMVRGLGQANTELDAEEEEQE